MPGAHERTAPPNPEHGPPWPLPRRVDLANQSIEDRAATAEASLRARTGVAVLIGDGPEGEIPIQVGACGDLRAFVAGRLRGDGPRADLSRVVTRVEACECGSGFEADLAFTAIARAIAPEIADRTAAQRAGVFVHLDPESTVPACRVITEADRLEGLAPGTLVGPFPARSHAEAWAGLLNTRFELCREPATLALHPTAQACAYKEMGLCPAPCDGSEAMDSYRVRCRAALIFDGIALERERVSMEARIREAAASMDFETAARLKREAESLAGVRIPAVGAITTMDRFGVVGVAPAGRAGWARVFVHRGGRTAVAGDVRAKGGEAASVVSAMAVACAPVAPGTFGAVGADAVAIIAQHLRSSRRTRATLLPVTWGDGPILERGPDPADLARAIRRAGGVETDSPDSEI